MYVFLESYTYLNELDSSVYKLYNNLLSFFYAGGKEYRQVNCPELSSPYKPSSKLSKFSIIEIC